MQFLLKLLLFVASVAVSSSIVPLTFAQTQSATDLNPKLNTEKFDDQKPAEILLWSNRIEGLVDYISSNSLDVYSLNEDDYQSTDIAHLIKVMLLVKKKSCVGDIDRLLNRITELATLNGDEQALKLGRILHLGKNANRTSLAQDMEQLKIYQNDPDWLVALMTKYVIRSLRITYDIVSVSRSYDTARMMIPSQSSERYELGKFLLDEMTSYEQNYQMNSQGSYESILKLILDAQTKNETASILVEVQNLIDFLVFEYGIENFQNHSERLLDLNFPDEMQAQVILMHHNSFSSVLSSETSRKILERAVNLDTPTGQMGQLARAHLSLLAVELDDKALVERYQDNDYFNAFRQSGNQNSRFIIIQLYMGEITLPEASQAITSSKQQDHYRRRKAMRKRESPFARTRIRFEDGLVTLIEPSVQIAQPPIRLMFRLTQEQVHSLDASLERLAGVNKVADESPYNGAKIAEYLNGANAKALSTLESQSEYSEVLGLSVSDLNTINAARENPIYLSTLRKAFIEHPVSLNAVSRPVNNIDAAYQKLLAIKLELGIGRVDLTWDRLKDLNRAQDLSPVEKSNLSLDILLTEAELLFLEGNTPALIAHVNDISREAVRLNRRLNAEKIMVLLALSLQNDGYSDHSARVVDAFLELRGPSEPSDLISFYLQGKMLFANGELESAEAVFSKGVDDATSPEDEALLLAELLTLYNSEGEVQKITETRTRLLNRIDDVDSETLFASFRPVLTRSTYILDKSQDEDTSLSYASYLKAETEWSNAEQTQRSNLSVRRISAERDALMHATNALEEAQLRQSSRETRYRVLFGLVTLLSVISGGVLYRSRKDTKLAILREVRTEKMQKLYSRALKDDYYQTKRLMTRIQQQITRILPRVADVRDEQLLELIGEDVEAHEQAITKNSFLRRIQLDDQKPISAWMSLHHFGLAARKYWEKQASGTDLKVVVKCQNGMPDVYVDEHYLTIIISEMTQRALDHTVFGVIELSVSYDPSEEIIMISVQDTGHGDQDPQTDYFLTEKAVAALGGTLNFIQTEGFAWSVQVICPALRAGEMRDRTIEVANASTIMSVNDR